MSESKIITIEEITLKKKKQFLKQFYWDSRELEKLERRLNNLTVKINSIRSSNPSFTPKGGTSLDIIDLLGQQEEYQQQIIKKLIKLEQNRQDIESSLDTLEDSKLRLILEYTYLENYSYKEIAAELKKSDRHIRRLHDIAIRLMKVVKKN